MMTLPRILATFVALMGLLNLQASLFKPSDVDVGSITFVNFVALWSGLVLLCASAALVLSLSRQSRYNSED